MEETPCGGHCAPRSTFYGLLERDPSFDNFERCEYFEYGLL